MRLRQLSPNPFDFLDTRESITGWLFLIPELKIVGAISLNIVFRLIEPFQQPAQ
jgi:hypothetical protein